MYEFYAKIDVYLNLETVRDQSIKLKIPKNETEMEMLRQQLLYIIIYVINELKYKLRVLYH